MLSLKFLRFQLAYNNNCKLTLLSDGKRMKLTVAEKVISQHLAHGKMLAGEEIALGNG